VENNKHVPMKMKLIHWFLHGVRLLKSISIVIEYEGTSHRWSGLHR
jgi:hypothetical protein